MRHVLLRLLPLLLLLPLVARAGEDVHAKLDSGEILVEIDPSGPGGVPTVRMQGVVDVPPAKLWPLIDHCGDYDEILPRIKASDELSREGNVVRCRTTVDAPWPMDDLTSITRAVHTVTPPYFKREWKMESGDYLVNEGSWTLTPFDAAGTRTLAVYEVRTKPKASVPGFMREFAQKRALPDVLKALRRHAAK